MNPVIPLPTGIAAEPPRVSYGCNETARVLFRRVSYVYYGVWPCVSRLLSTVDTNGNPPAGRGYQFVFEGTMTFQESGCL